MTSNGYTKLFASILYSSVWQEPAEIRIVWITMMAMADKNGVVNASIPGLASAARVSVEQCVEALETFKKPDKFSRSKELEGRKIQDVDGGWFLVNHAKYRDIIGKDEMRAYKASKQREYRKTPKYAGMPSGRAYQMAEEAGASKKQLEALQDERP